MNKTLDATELQFAWDVFVTACESGVQGISAWASIETYRHCEADKVMALALVIDQESGKKYRITPATIKKGLDVIDAGDWTKNADLGMHRSYRAAIHVARLARDAGEIDGPLADMIVQVGLFGEVIYG